MVHLIQDSFQRIPWNIYIETETEIETESETETDSVNGTWAILINIVVWYYLECLCVMFEE